MIRILLKQNVPAAAEHEAGRALLERALGAAPAVKIRPGGKPYLAGEPYFFNLSHSHGIVGLALARQEIGFDLEPLGRPIRRKGFLAENDAPVDPLLGWVLKESAVKLTGAGIALLRNSRLLPKKEGCWTVLVDGVPCTVQDFTACGCVCAVATYSFEEYRIERENQDDTDQQG